MQTGYIVLVGMLFAFVAISFARFAWLDYLSPRGSISSREWWVTGVGLAASLALTLGQILLAVAVNRR